MNNQNEFILNQLKVWPGLCDKMMAALAQEELPYKDWRSWLILFKQLSRMHRNYLHWADWYNAMPFSELTKQWRHFIQTGTTICKEHTNMLFARMEKPRLPTRQLCSLANMLATVLKLSREFEGYKREMIARVPPSKTLAG